MERAVDRADRVLLVCTDIYVQKADDGTGGVGYEAMIVTGELAKNLGMNKFIPLIRQSHGNRRKPKFLETKFHVDFSDDSCFEERPEELLREIHKAPKYPKPKVGKNPFLGESAGHAVISPTVHLNLSVTSDVPHDAQDAYFCALELIRSDDRIAWRKFYLKASSTIAERLVSWRSGGGDSYRRI